MFNILTKVLGLFRPDPLLPNAESWDVLTRRLPLLQGLDQAEQAKLRWMVGDFLARKRFHGGENLPVEDTMKLLIATQACIPVLGLGMNWYRGWSTIVVYADEFLVPRSEMDNFGVMHERQARLIGEAWPDGPVVLSWPHVQEAAEHRNAGNVVVHEFAHKLDMLNCNANGMPPLHRNMHRETWTRVMQDAFDELNHWVDQGQLMDTPFDAYMASNPAEFFASLSELFFTEATYLQSIWSEVYEQLRLFYRQDPAVRTRKAQD